jgi:hypothetical protein
MPSSRDEVALERALVFLYRQWELLGYQSGEFYEMLRRGCNKNQGGMAAAQAVLRENKTGVFVFLKKRRKLALSIEHLVLRPRWAHLFTEADRRMAEEKLREAPLGFDQIYMSPKPKVPEFQTCAVEVRGTGTEFKENVARIKQDLAHEGWEFIRLSEPTNGVPRLLFKRPNST